MPIFYYTFKHADSINMSQTIFLITVALIGFIALGILFYKMLK